MRYLSPSNNVGDGRGAFSLNPSDCVYSLILTAGGAKTVEIPEGAKHAVFSSSVDFFAIFGDVDLEDSFVPTTDINDGSSPEMSPGMRTFPAEITHMSLIGIEAGQMTIAFYKG